MPTPVEVPKLGNTVEECIVARWVKRTGDSVAAGEIVAEIETDKATFEVTAPVSGTVLATFFDEGALAPVFSRLFVLGEPGESVDAEAPVAIAETPVAVVETPVPQAYEAPRERHDAPMSPRARKFAKEHGVNASKVNGSGPGGRILEQDLRKLAESGTKISHVRERIARRMRESLVSTAQYTMHSWADASALLRVRAAIKGRHDVNINDLVTFCAVEALMEVPDLNAEFVDGRIRKHDEVHIGFACDTPRGLLVPVVRNADTMCADELASRMKELASQAVAGTIAGDDLAGATFTVSNLGGLGVESFTPLLNPPQVAILGVGAISLRPVRREGRVDFVDAIALSLTCDHQVIDGAPGARFLQVVRKKIEEIADLCGLC